MTSTDPPRARDEWWLYRRGLPARQRGEEEAFDAMWDSITASLHVLPRRVPMIDVLFLIGIQQEAALMDLRREVGELRAEVRARARQVVMDAVAADPRLVGVGAPAGSAKAAAPEASPAGHGARARGQQRLGE